MPIGIANNRLRIGRRPIVANITTTSIATLAVIE
jgi:hypothetical protein